MVGLEENSPPSIVVASYEAMDLNRAVASVEITARADKFQLNPETQEIVTKANYILDYETSSSQNIKLAATDNDNDSLRGKVAILDVD